MLPDFPPKLSLASLPSPFKALDRISAELGGPRIWIKSDDMTGSLLSGNKVRKLEYVVAKARAESCDTLITCGGLQSNHCRATALVGAQLGLKVHLILRGRASDEPDGNLLLDQLAGAEISVYKPEEYFTRLDALFREWQEYYTNLGRKAYTIPTGASDGTGIWGYVEASIELQNDFEREGIEPELVVCATGSGGTQAGLTLGFALQGSASRVVGMAVCDDEAYFRNKAQADIRAWFNNLTEEAKAKCRPVVEIIEIETNDSYIGPGYARAYPEVYETIKWLAAREGQVLDPVYTGKAFYGLLSEIKNGSFADYKNIVFVHTGGVYGLFPYRTELVQFLNGKNGKTK